MFTKIGEWLAEMVAKILASMFVNDINKAFEDINNLLTNAQSEVSQTPANWMGGAGANVQTFLQSIVKDVLIPVGGIILAYAVIYDFITAIVEKNNMKEFDTSIFLRFILKTSIGIYFLANSWNISMAVFDLGSYIVSESGWNAYYAHSANLTVNVAAATQTLVDNYKSKNLSLMDLYLMWQYGGIFKLSTIALTFSMTIVLWGRMIEIFIYCSVSPIPFATLTNRDLGDIGKNYFKALFALALQGFFIIICIIIYSAISSTVLTHISANITGGLDVINDILLATGTGIVLCFTLFKTSAISKSILNAH